MLKALNHCGHKPPGLYVGTTTATDKDEFTNTFEKLNGLLNVYANCSHSSSHLQRRKVFKETAGLHRTPNPFSVDPKRQ
jgi:hypothetical protein